MRLKKIIFSLIIIVLASLTISYYYHRDRNKFEPILWQGYFDYRLNFRDVGQSLNQCYGRKIFKEGKIYRSNKYFSGWSCEKIGSPNKIYSLNFNPKEPHAYYCIQKDGQKQFGQHPDQTFEITEIENIKQWDKPEFKRVMCSFIDNSLNDLISHNSFLYHCDAGRDRTGAYTALLSILLAEQKGIADGVLDNVIECDYEKTHSLEQKKFGNMKKYVQEIKSLGGFTKFVMNKCNISQEKIIMASKEFLN